MIEGPSPFPAALPEIPELKRLMQSLAMLDAILSPDWELRYYSFNADWFEGEQMGSMRNGSGDDVFVLFSAAGCLIKGFAHELSRTEADPGALYGQLPPPFAGQALEPAFSPASVTFCYWRGEDDEAWSAACVPGLSQGDGSSELLRLFDARPESYREYALEYFERELPLPSIASIYRHEPLSPPLAQALNPDIDWEGLDADAREIAYPLAG